MLSESNIIHELKKIFPTHIGDDAAVLTPTATRRLVITKDILVENKHFRTRYVEPAALAHKALHVNLSDLAAMSAQPQYILCGIAIPARLADYAQLFLTALAKACLTANVILIGGDTTASAHDLFISITAIGEADQPHLKTRSQAKPGDAIALIGELGLAHLGFLALEKNLANFPSEKKAFLYPEAKIQAGLWLGQHAAITSLMDVSDGLFVDLTRLCQASNVGAKVQLDQLPLTQDFKSACAALQLDPLTTALTGGEDYGLLFTIHQDDVENITKAYAKAHSQPLHVIGEIQSDQTIDFYDHHEKRELHLTPFTHFGEHS